MNFFEGAQHIESPQTREIRTVFKVKEDWIDGNDHVSGGTIIAEFVRAQNELFTELIGANVGKALDMLGTKIFVKKQTTEFFVELKRGDGGDIGTKAKLGNSSLVFQQEMYNQRRELVAQSEFVVVLVDDKSKPVPIPEKVRAILLEK